MSKSMKSRVGSYVITTFGNKTVKAYIPVPLPPYPPVNLSRLHGRIDRANRAIGRLDGLSSLIPDTNLLLYTYVRKEAVLSSQDIADDNPNPRIDFVALRADVEKENGEDTSYAATKIPIQNTATPRKQEM